jgi:hypothetical protein
VKLAKKAIELKPDESCAHFALGNAHKVSGDSLRASECYISAVERTEPDSEDWAQAVVHAWDTRQFAARCGYLNIFCGCERCAALHPRGRRGCARHRRW